MRELRTYLEGVAAGAAPRGSDPRLSAALENCGIRRCAAAWAEYARAEAAPAGDHEPQPPRHELPWHQLPPLL